MSYREFYRRHLPHWQPVNSVLFVTFRLAGSLPLKVIEDLRHQHQQAQKALEKIADPTARHSQANLDSRRTFGKWDEALDKCERGARWLAEPEIAEIVAQALQDRDRKVFDLFAYCIMPNHVHLVCQIVSPQDDRNDNPASGKDEYPIMLHKIMKSLKGYTAYQANLILGRKGTFWQEENYDHVARDAKELDRIIQYVINNPVKAGLVKNWEEWPWTYCKIWPD